MTSCGGGGVDAPACARHHARMGRRGLSILGAAAVALVLLVAGSAVGAYLYAQSALANVLVTLDRVTVSTSSPAGGSGPLDLLARGLSTNLVLDETFEVDNRNAIGATVESIDYHVRLNGRDVGTGRAPESGTTVIAGNSKQAIVARTSLPVTGLLAAGVESLAQGQAKIDVVGTARIKVLVFTVERQFELTPQKLDGERLDQVLTGGK